MGGGVSPTKRPQNRGVRGWEHPPPPHESLRAPRGAALLPTALLANINHPLCPGQGVADTAGDSGTTLLSPSQTCHPPDSPGGQGAGPGALARGDLSSCSQDISRQGWSPGLGSVGKGWQEARDREAGTS